MNSWHSRNYWTMNRLLKMNVATWNQLSRIYHILKYAFIELLMVIYWCIPIYKIELTLFCSESSNMKLSTRNFWIVQLQSYFILYVPYRNYDIGSISETISSKIPGLACILPMVINAFGYLQSDEVRPKLWTLL